MGQGTSPVQSGHPSNIAPYQVVDFVSQVICKIRHTHSKKERNEFKQQQNEQTPETSDD